MADEVANADDLYGLAPGEFIAARDALARRLRAEGDREQATVVKALRRPSATASALNRAARAHPDLLQAALDAGEQLRAATEDALEGDAAGLRAATGEERAASGRFLTAAEAFLGSASPEARQRMAATLRAALLDDEVRDALLRGVLAGDHEPAGAGFGLGGSSTAAPRAKRAPTKTAADDAPGAAERRRELIAAVARLEKAHKARTASADKAAAKAERAAAAAREAEEAALEARATADAAAEAAWAADAAAADAAEDLERARAELDDQR